MWLWKKSFIFFRFHKLNTTFALDNGVTAAFGAAVSKRESGLNPELYP